MIKKQDIFPQKSLWIDNLRSHENLYNKRTNNGFRNSENMQIKSIKEAFVHRIYEHLAKF